MRTKIVVAFLVLLMVTLAVSAAPPVEGRGRRWHKDYLLIVLTGNDATLRESVSARVAELGGDTGLYFDPGVLIGHLPTADVEALAQMPGVRLVTKGTVEHPEAMGLDARALMAVRYFNWSVSGDADEEADRAPKIDLHGDVGMETPPQLPRDPRVVANALQNNDNSSRRTSMTGTLVSLMLMETPAHPWTLAQQQTAFNGVADAMSWWSARLLAHFGTARPAVSPSFWVELPPAPQGHPDQEMRTVATTGEAAGEIQGHVENIVTTTLMSACSLYHPDTPCPWSSKSGYEAVEAFNDDQQAVRHTANAITAFITNNSYAGAPTSFPIGERTDAAAYAVFLGGPYWIGMTSLGPHLPSAAAHETAHLFWAEDEYPEQCSTCAYPINASYPGYTPPHAGTFLNGNCQNSGATCVLARHKHDCIMYTLGGYTEATEYDKVCEFTRMQINWTGYGCYNDVNWDGAGGPDTHWRGAYYYDYLGPRFPPVHWREAARLVRDDGNADGFNITLPITDSCFTATQYTSARWKREVNFAPGSYKFHVDAQDGFNFYVDGGTPLLSRQTYSGSEVTTDPIVLSAGLHDITLEVYAAAGGKAHLSWEFLGACPGTGTITVDLSPQADAISPACSNDTVRVLVTPHGGGTPPYHLTFRRDDNSKIEATTVADPNNFNLLYVTLPTGPARADSLALNTYTLLNLYDAHSCPGTAGAVLNVLTSPNPHFTFGKNLSLTQTNDCGLQISWLDANPVDCSRTDLVFNVVNENTGKVLASCLGPETRTVTVRDLVANDFRRYAVIVEDHITVANGLYKCRSGQTGKLEYAFVPTCTTGGLNMTASATAAGYGAALTLRSSLTGDGAPLANRTVTFDISGTNAGSAVTDATGVATLTTTATLPAANYPNALTAHFGGDGTYGSTSVTGNIYIPKGTPTITWPTPADIVYGTLLGTDQLNATASTTGTFTYAPPLGTLLESGDGQPLQVSFVPSDVTNYNYASATVYINVHKAPQTITWSAPASVGYGAALSATQLNATISVPGPDPAADLVYDPTFGTVLPVGNYTLNVSADETTNYLPATKSVPFSVVSCMPTITAQPQDAILNNGVPVVLSVTATNAGSYEWFEGTPSQSSRPFAFTSSVSVTPTVDTTYWVRVHGVCNMWVDSRVAAVRVCIPPSGWAVPASVNLASGQTANLSVHIQAGTDTVIQWYTGAAGNTSAPLSNTTANISVSPTVTTQYWARVSNTCGSFDTVAITVDVCSLPIFTTQPASTDDPLRPDHDPHGRGDGHAGHDVLSVVQRRGGRYLDSRRHQRTDVHDAGAHGRPAVLAAHHARDLLVRFGDGHGHGLRSQRVGQRYAVTQWPVGHAQRGRLRSARRRDDELLVVSRQCRRYDESRQLRGVVAHGQSNRFDALLGARQ